MDWTNGPLDYFLDYFLDHFLDHFLNCFYQKVIFRGWWVGIFFIYGAKESGNW